VRPTLLLPALVLTLAACGGSTNGVDVVGSTAATPPGGTWVLTSSAPDVGVPDGAHATLQLDGFEDRTMQAGGDTPCNSFGGEATSAADGTWSWQLTDVTEMGCEPPRQDAQDAYLDALAATSQWSLDDSDLVLTGDGVELRFAQQEQVDTSALTGTDWILVGFVDGEDIIAADWDAADATLRLDGTPEGGTFEMFSGCRDFTGDWVADGDTIRWPSWGQADDSRDVADCNDAELESEGLVLAAVEGGFTTEVDQQDIGAFLTVRSAADSSVGLHFRGPQAGE